MCVCVCVFNLSFGMNSTVHLCMYICFFLAFVGLLQEYLINFADCFCTIRIVDESHQKPGLAVNIFAEHFGALPHVVALGDIIQLSHVMVFPCSYNLSACKFVQDQRKLLSPSFICGNLDIF